MCIRDRRSIPIRPEELTIVLNPGVAAAGGGSRRSFGPRGRAAGWGEQGEGLVCRPFPSKNQHWKEIPRNLVYTKESRKGDDGQAEDNENGKPGFPGIAGQEERVRHREKPCNKNNRGGGNVLILPITPGGYPYEEKRDGSKENKAKRDLLRN